MKEVLVDVINTYRMFFGTGIYGTLFVLSILYMIVKEREKGIKQIFLGILIIFSIVYVCPVSAYVIMEYGIGADVYWRMFWMLPITVLIAYVLTKEIFDFTGNWKRYIVLLGIGLALAQSGRFIYTENFQARQNAYKLSLHVVHACDAILEDARENGIEEICVIGGADEFAVQARQYSADIHMPYGRNGIRGEKMGKRATQIYDAIHDENGIDAEKLIKLARKGKYQYLVYYAREESIPILETAGYEWLMQVGGYYIYKLKL